MQVVVVHCYDVLLLIPSTEKQVHVIYCMCPMQLYVALATGDYRLARFLDGGIHILELHTKKTILISVYAETLDNISSYWYIA